MLSSQGFVSALILSAVAGPLAGQSVVDVLEWELTTRAVDASMEGQAEFKEQEVNLPLELDRVATHGSSESSSKYAFEVHPRGTAIGFGVEFQQSRASTMASEVTSEGFIRFVATGSLVYETKGVFFTRTSRGPISLSATLFDVTADAVVFDSFQESIASTELPLYLGGMNGDSANSFEGVLSGELVAGHEYVFSYAVTLAGDVDSGAGDAQGKLVFGVAAGKSSSAAARRSGRRRR